MALGIVSPVLLIDSHPSWKGHSKQQMGLSSQFYLLRHFAFIFQGRWKDKTSSTPLKNMLVYTLWLTYILCDFGSSGIFYLAFCCLNFTYKVSSFQIQNGIKSILLITLSWLGWCGFRSAHIPLIPEVVHKYSKKINKFVWMGKTSDQSSPWARYP